MKDAAEGVIKEKFGESLPCRILKRISEPVSKLKHQTSSTRHWHAYSAILTALALELGSKDIIAEFAHGIGVSPAALSKAASRRAAVDGDDEGSLQEQLWFDENKGACVNVYV